MVQNGTGGADPFTRERPADKTGTTLLKDLLFCGICGRKLEIHKRKNGTLLIMPCRKVLPDSDIKCNNQGVKLQSLEEEVLQQLQSDKRLQWDQHLQPQEQTSILMDLHERLMLI
ncbi:zinc ribbon domain-containing protein, partial [Paenibacillus enshidis]